MFYRRKIILGLLELFEGRLERIRLQKLLFLFSKKQAKPEYDFVPYKFGCFSYSAQADVTTMISKGIISDDNNGLVKQDTGHYLKLLKEADRKILLEVKKLYGTLNGNALMKHTYVNFPYWAINSVKAPEILSKQELEIVLAQRPNQNDTLLFTIGYEGISLEAYLNKLLKNGVKVLVDVRKNPLSMKYGFSKNLLKRFCESIGIDYIHFPEVGIESDQRQELNSQEDYNKLFKQYKNSNLTQTTDIQQNILRLLIDKKRIALTCFEANICQCHRKPLAESLLALSGNEYKLKHI